MRVEGSFQTTAGWYFEPVLGGGVRVHAAQTGEPLTLDAETWDEVIAFVDEVQQWGDATLAPKKPVKKAVKKITRAVKKPTKKAAKKK